jgi:hypothetical protein
MHGHNAASRAGLTASLNHTPIERKMPHRSKGFSDFWLTDTARLAH